MDKTEKTTKAVESPNKAKNVPVEEKYTFAEFVANSTIFGVSADIVSAALTEKKIKETTVSEAKKIVKEFKERKVK